MKKQKHLENLRKSLVTHKLGLKVITALRENIEIRNHKKHKTLLAYQIYEHNLQKFHFIKFRALTKDLGIERLMKTKSKQLYQNKLL